MTAAFDQFNLQAIARFDRHRALAIRLFEREELRGMLLCLEPGQQIAVHAHGNEHEALDVISGRGAIIVDDVAVAAGPGKMVFLPAGTSHGLRNDGPDRWIVRATIHQRTYPRHIGRLVVRALRKRLALAPR